MKNLQQAAIKYFTHLVLNKCKLNNNKEIPILPHHLNCTQFTLLNLGPPTQWHVVKPILYQRDAGQGLTNVQIHSRKIPNVSPSQSSPTPFTTTERVSGSK
jgi:hypothetical protein